MGKDCMSIYYLPTFPRPFDRLSLPPCCGMKSPPEPITLENQAAHNIHSKLISPPLTGCTSQFAKDNIHSRKIWKLNCQCFAVFFHKENSQHFSLSSLRSRLENKGNRWASRRSLLIIEFQAIRNEDWDQWGCKLYKIFDIGINFYVEPWAVSERCWLMQDRDLGGKEASWALPSTRLPHYWHWWL